MESYNAHSFSISKDISLILMKLKIRINIDKILNKDKFQITLKFFFTSCNLQCLYMSEL